MVRQQLKGNDVQQALQAVDRLGNTDRLGTGRDAVVTLVANDDRLSLARGNLGERRLHLGEEGVTGHDDDYRHVFVNERERAVLKFTSKDTWQMH